MLTTVFTFAVLGAAAGALYALGSISLVLVYRSSGVLNFAAGAIGTVGVFVYWDLQVNEHWTVGTAMVAGILASALVGAVVGLLMRQMRAASNLTKVVLTLAVLVVIQGLISIRYPDSYMVNSLLPTGPVRVFGAAFGQDRLLLIAIAVLLTIVVAAVYRFTRFGLATSAAAENTEGLATLGWSADRVALLNWAIAGALSGLAGILLAPITGVSVALTTALLLPSLAGAVVGNLQSFSMSLVGAMLIGIVQAEVGRYVTLTGAGDAVPFAVIIVIIVIRGRKLPLRSYVAERLPRVSSGKINIPLLIGAAVVGVISLQWLLSPVWVGAFTFSLIGILLLYSIVVVTGYTGQISLAQWAIAGCGAMVVAQLRVHGVPWTLAVLCGLVAAVPIGLIVGSAAMRARGVSLAIATLAFGVCMVSLVLSNPSVNGGVGGLYVGTFSLFGIDLDAGNYPRRYALLCLGLALVVGVAVANIRRGNAGRRLVAVRSNENAAAALGINVRRAKLAAFCYGSVLASLAGILTIATSAYASFSAFDAFTSIQLVSNGVLGSVGYVNGSLVGGAGASGGVLNQLFSGIGSTGIQYLPVVLGALTIVTVIQAPDGLVAMNIDLFRRLGRRTRRPRPVKRIVVENAGPVAQLESDDGVSTLVVSDLSVRFGTVVALDAVSFDLQAGQVLGVIGPNGAGKTTLIDALTGFVSTSGGHAALDERTLDRLPPQRIAQAGLGRSFQALELFRDMTVYENLVAACDERRWSVWLRDPVWPSRMQLTPVCEAIVVDLGLQDTLHSYPDELSFGTQRLVAIARTVASGPRFIMLDEPAAGLDAHERVEVRGVIRRLADEWGLGVLLVEHDVALVADVSDRMLALEFGRVVADGEPDMVTSHPAVLAAYLGEDVDAPTAEAATGEQPSAKVHAAVRP